MIAQIKRFYEILGRYCVIDMLLIIVAMAFVLQLKWLYVDSTQFMPQYFFNNERILTTNDGYHYANATRDVLEGYKGEAAFFPSAEFEMPALISVMLYKILPFSLGELFYFMSIFISTLLVIPVYLIARNFANPLVAFLSALLAPITQSYAVRTMGGYYDTDMLILTIPLFVAYFLLKVLDSADCAKSFALDSANVDSAFLLDSAINTAFCPTTRLYKSLINSTHSLKCASGILFLSLLSPIITHTRPLSCKIESK